MQKEWSSYRITLLLYFVVLLLPFSFYFIHTSFQTMQHDTTIVRQSSWVTGAMAHFRTNDQQQIAAIDKSFNQISHWAQKNNTSDLYIGRTTLVEDLKEVTDCWSAFKKDGTGQCYDLSNNLAIVIEKMVYLKQKKIINIFYMSLTLGMILILLTIYFVRTYILLQIKKHAIHDLETNLFNKKYFLSLLESACAKSTRYKEPLSILWLSLGVDENISKQNRKEILKHFGKLMHDIIRISDTPAKYYDTPTASFFAVLLPYTKEEDAQVLEKRLHEFLEKDEVLHSSNITFNIATSQFEYEELPDVFIARSRNRLKSTSSESI